ncbi:MAG: hypothetical protein WC123_05990 [Bacilli bacterium]
MELIYKHEDLIDIFNDISPFNMKRDIKYINKKKISIDKILQEIEAKLISQNYDVEYEKEFCNEINNKIVLVKVRIINPQNNKGESSGFRVVGIVNECDDYAIIFNLFPKDGSKRKDNLTNEELEKAKHLLCEYLES